MRQSLALLVVRRFEPNRKPSCWWRSRVMALGAEPREGGPLWSRDGRIELLDYHRSLVGKQMLVRGAASCGCQRGGELWIFLPSSEPPVPFPTDRGATNGRPDSNSKGGSLTVDEARQRESRGNDKLQARKARKRHHQPLNTMRHRDVERVQHSGTNLAVAKGGEEIQRGTLSSLGLISHHRTQQLGPWLRDSQLANDTSQQSEGTALNQAWSPPQTILFPSFGRARRLVILVRLRQTSVSPRERLLIPGAPLCRSSVARGPATDRPKARLDLLL